MLTFLLVIVQSITICLLFKRVTLADFKSYKRLLLLNIGKLAYCPQSQYSHLTLTTSSEMRIKSLIIA